MKTTILGLIAVLSFALFSCQNIEGTSSTTSNEDQVLKSAAIAVNDVAVESVAQEADYEADFFAESEHLLRQLSHYKGKKNLMKGRSGTHYANDNCPNVSIDTASTGYPIVITIDYGDSTELHNGRFISGIVTIEISAPRGTDGKTNTITYTNCVIDSITINGVSTEVFTGDNETTRIVTISSDVTFELADGTVLDRVGTRVREWIAGLDTPMEHSDDMIQITGSIEITSSTGDNWEKLIVEPLIKTGECRHPVQGTVQYSQNGVIISELNYGDGECDNIATLTVDGETVEIELQGNMPKANCPDNNGNGKDNGNKNGGKH